MTTWIVLFALIIILIIFFKNPLIDFYYQKAHKKNRKSHTHDHGSFVSIDYLAYSSNLRHWNSNFKFVLSLLTIVFSLTLNNVYVSLLVIFTIAFLIVNVGKLSFHSYLSVLKIPMAFIILSMLAIAVDFSKIPIGKYYLNLGFTYIYTTFEMLKNTFFLSLRIIASISGLQFLILTTPSNEVISVLKKLHLPNEFIDLMHMIYRFIFIMFDLFYKMKNSAESRLGFANFRASCYSFSNIASNMLILSLKKSNAYFDAMEARGYDGELLFLEDEKKLDMKLVIYAVIFFIILLLLWYLTN